MGGPVVETVETSKYEDFIATKLKPALEEVEAEREKVAVTRDACVELCEQISKVLEEGEAEEKTPTMETAVEIGERCFVQAVIPDASTLVVDTGVMGVLVEMPLQQALEFVAARAMLLQRQAPSHAHTHLSLPSPPLPLPLSTQHRRVDKKKSCGQ